jgi:hypothetical protein
MPPLVAALALLAATLGVSTSALAAAPTPAPRLSALTPQTACDWNAPGHNPFMGDVVAAIDAYQDIPAAVRARLQQRMARRAYDEVVRIRRDSIDGRRSYRSEIRDMHFGNGQRCATVDRSAWTAQAVERGLVYCEAGHCILVPTVCRNVSRIALADGGRGGAGAVGAAEGSTQATATAQPAADAGQRADAPREDAGAASALAGPAGAADSAALPLSQVVGGASPEAASGSGGPGGAWNGPVFDQGAGAGLAPPVLRLDEAWSDGLDSPDRWLLDPVSPSLFRPPLVTPPLPAVPEPATGLLMLAGLLLLPAWRRRVSRG